MPDEEAKEKFKDTSPELVKEKYKKLLEKITKENYDGRKIINKVTNLKNQGNAFQKEGKFTEAIEAYKNALEVLPELKLKSESEELEIQLKLNRARAFNKLKEFEQAINECEQVNTQSTNFL